MPAAMYRMLPSLKGPVERIARVFRHLAISVYGPKIEILGQGPHEIKSLSLLGLIACIPEEGVGRISRSRKHLNQ